MRVRNFPFAIAAILVFLTACNRSGVSLSYTNAKDEVPQLGNLIFRFSKSLVKDTMLNIWDSTDYVSFEPRIAGRFRWESPDQLVFSPSQPLAPATTYNATIKNAVLKFSKYDKVEEAGDIKFHTPDLALDNSQVTWMLVDETSRMAVPQLDLYFNYLVNPNNLKDKLKIEVDGAKADFAPVTLSADNKISVRIQGLKQEDKNLTAKIII
jgi:hypothetical protein